jgi:hypothetical protein
VTDEELGKAIADEVIAIADAHLSGVISKTVLLTFPVGTELTADNIHLLWEQFKAIEKEYGLPSGWLRGNYRTLLKTAFTVRNLIKTMNKAVLDASSKSRDAGKN